MRLGWIVAILCLSMNGVPAFAADSVPPSLGKLVLQIQAAYEDTNEWSAEFRQITRIAGFETQIKSEGKLYIKKPGKMRWDYQKPNQHQIVVNKEKVWIYTPEQTQVIVNPLASISDSQLPLHFLSGIGRLDQDFSVEWTNPDRPFQEGSPSLKLIPRKPGTGLTHLQIQVDPEKYFIRQLTLYEVNGNQVYFDFSRVHKNSGLKDRFFVFIPPMGITVVESPLTQP